MLVLSAVLRPVLRVVAALALSLVALVGCAEPEPGPSGPPPLFEVAELSSWTELRDCRGSHEHALRHIRVVADPLAEGPYAALSPDHPYPVGARLVKVEYDDEGCTELLGYTAMRKLPEGTMPEAGDWLWQSLDAEARVLEEGNLRACIICHTVHCPWPYFGYDLTCAEEL